MARLPASSLIHGGGATRRDADSSLQEGKLGTKVAENVTYYAIIRNGRSIENASGLARRTLTPEGRLDEALRRSLAWERDSAIYEWEYGDVGAELVEISETEAAELIERFQVRWGEAG